jgi:PhnB protein
MVKAIPEGLHALTLQLSIDGCAQAIEWYKKAFDAQEVRRAPDPSGKKIWHAELRIGDSTFMVNDTFPEMGAEASRASTWLYTEDVDAAWKRAVDAGGKVKMPLSDMFWGDRMGTLVDPFGNQWSLARRIKNLTNEEMQRAQDEFVASMSKR